MTQRNRMFCYEPEIPPTSINEIISQEIPDNLAWQGESQSLRRDI